MEYHSQMTQEDEALLVEQKFQEMLNAYKNSPHRKKIEFVICEIFTSLQCGLCEKEALFRLEKVKIDNI